MPYSKSAVAKQQSARGNRRDHMTCTGTDLKLALGRRGRFSTFRHADRRVSGIAFECTCREMYASLFPFTQLETSERPMFSSRTTAQTYVRVGPWANPGPVLDTLAASPGDCGGSNWNASISRPVGIETRHRRPAEVSSPRRTGLNSPTCCSRLSFRSEVGRCLQI